MGVPPAKPFCPIRGTFFLRQPFQTNIRHQAAKGGDSRIHHNISEGGGIFNGGGAEGVGHRIILIIKIE